MEDNISGQENGLGFKIEQFISLDTIGITKKDTGRALGSNLDLFLERVDAKHRQPRTLR